MEDVIILIITAALMIGGAINAANKRKKEAARKASSRPMPEQGREVRHKSLSDILRELEEKTGEPGWLSEQEQEQEQEPEPEIEVESEPEYYSMGADSLEERAMAEARLEAMSYRPVEKSPAMSASHMAGDAAVVSHMAEVTDPEAGLSIAAPEKEPETLNEILGGGFDLKRAIIESEILKPKYEHY